MHQVILQSLFIQLSIPFIFEVYHSINPICCLIMLSLTFSKIPSYYVLIKLWNKVNRLSDPSQLQRFWNVPENNNLLKVSSPSILFPPALKQLNVSYLLTENLNVWLLANLWGQRKVSMTFHIFLLVYRNSLYIWLWIPCQMCTL